MKSTYIRLAYKLAEMTAQEDDLEKRVILLYDASFWLGKGLGGTGVYIPYDDFPPPPQEKCYVL